MRRIRMLRTRDTRAGLLKAGKRYPVPDDVAAELVADEVAHYLDGPSPETATRSADENAAERTGGPPEWTLQTPPREYLETYGADAANSDLARRIIAAGGADDE